MNFTLTIKLDDETLKVLSRLLQVSVIPKAAETTVRVSGRTFNIMRMLGIKYWEQLEHIEESELLRIPNMGRKSLNELREAMGNIGLTLSAKPTKRQDMPLVNGSTWEIDYPKFFEQVEGQTIILGPISS